MPREYVICEGCFLALDDDWPGMDESQKILILTDTSMPIADHLCDRIDTDGEIECDCVHHEYDAL